MKKVSPTGGGGRRKVARAFVLATAVATVAPLAATATANAASNRLTIRPTHHLTKAQLADLGKLTPAELAHHGAGTAEPGLDRSQFPAHGQVAAMLQLNLRPASRVFVAARRMGSNADAVSAAREQRAQIDSLAHSVESHFSAPATAAHPLFSVHNVYAGVAVRTSVSKLAALSRLSGVVAVHPLPTYHVTNASTVPLIGAPQVWSGAGKDIGTGVKIGIIDTGIDYTHANFGGTGSARAYEADHAVADEPTLNVPSGDYPSAKVAGGIDLAGDAYDASSSDPAVATPHTDPNPLDCNSHGSHVAGTAAGLGVTTDGNTFKGDYSSLSSLTGQQYRDTFRIGPGVAPGATLYAIRVFGCEGSTNLVSEALDWAADPNGDGNFNDHLDVVNMSLGSDFGVPDDADAVASNNASLLGITVVAAAGNGGDTQAIAGTPANASRVISVAASDDAMTVYDAMRVNAPDADAGTIAGQRSVAYDWADNGPTTGDVAAVDPTFDPNATGAYSADNMKATNADGCDTFTSAQAAAVAGKIAWMEWTDGTSRRCGSAGRSANAVAAGAIGAVFTDDQDHFAAGITGSPVIPVFQIRKVDSDLLRPAAQAGTLNVTLTNDLANSITIIDPSTVDQVASFSSRGWGATDSIKPDITAPGVSVFSTGMGTGNQGLTDSGTSMATPHTAGMAALVKAAHKSWFPEQIKAALMNTANNKVTSTDGTVEAPDRVGAGRAEVDRAVATNVLAYSFGTDGGVGLSFGMPQVTAPTTMSRLFKVENNSGSVQTYDLSYVAANSGTQPAGVTFSLPPTVTVPAHSTVTEAVQMDVDPSAMDRPVDAARDQSDDLFGMPNQWFVPEASGWVTLNQAGTEQLRLPLYAAPRPASDVHATDSALTFAGQNGSVIPNTPPQWDFSLLGLTGDGVNTSSYQSLLSGYELGATSPEKPDCTSTDTDLSQCTAMPSLRASDIQYVGATSDYSALRDFVGDPTPGDDSLTYFAVSTYGNWRSPSGLAEFDVNIDTNGDGQPDAILFNAVTGEDNMITALVDANTGDILDEELLNGVGAGADTNGFDNNVMVLPVWSHVLDQLAPSGNITYWVDSFDIYGGLSDETAPAEFNFQNPGLLLSGANPADPFADAATNAWNNSFSALPLYWVDDHSSQLAAIRDKAAAQADGTQGLLLIHSNNVGSTAEVLGIGDTTNTAVSLSRSTAQYSQPVKANVTVTAPGGEAPAPSGTVNLLVNGFKVGSASLNSLGKATLTLPKLPVNSSKYHVTASYVGDGTDLASTSNAALLQVVKQVTSTAVKASKAKPAKGSKEVFTATVTGAKGTTAVPTGSVTFFKNGTKWKTVKLVNGKASVAEKNFGKGSHTVKAVYSGNKNQKRSSGSVTITVV